MLKQVKIRGQSFELYSADHGRTWSSSAGSLVAFERRKKTGRLKLQESFQHIGEIQDDDPDEPMEIANSQKGSIRD
jgi:hypothetical protein